MPWLNKRWISFFIISAVVGVVFISLVGWASDQEGRKLRNKFGQFFFSLFRVSHRDHHWHSLCKDSFGTDEDLLPIYTNSQVLITGVQASSFDPNGKTGPAVSPTYWCPVSMSDNNPFHAYSLALSLASWISPIWPHPVSVMCPAPLYCCWRENQND